MQQRSLAMREANAALSREVEVLRGSREINRGVIKALKAEIDTLQGRGVDVESRMVISPACPVIMPYHAQLDRAREAALGAYPGARAGAVLAMVVLGAVGVWWTGRLERDTGSSEGAPARATPARVVTSEAVSAAVGHVGDRFMALLIWASRRWPGRVWPGRSDIRSGR